MLNMKNWGNRSTLVSAVSTMDNVLSVTVGDGNKFTVPTGDYFYATIKYNGVREVVKVVRTVGDKLTVTRHEDGTVAQSFPKGACIEIEWNPVQLCEYVTACVNGDTISGMSGTHCIDCGTCITLDGGKITSIDGVVSC